MNTPTPTPKALMVKRLPRKSNFDTAHRYEILGMGCKVFVESAYLAEGEERVGRPLTVASEIVRAIQNHKPLIDCAELALEHLSKTRRDQFVGVEQTVIDEIRSTIIKARNNQ